MFKSLFIGSGLKYLKTVSISHAKQYFGFGGLLDTSQEVANYCVFSYKTSFYWFMESG